MDREFLDKFVDKYDQMIDNGFDEDGFVTMDIGQISYIVMSVDTLYSFGDLEQMEKGLNKAYSPLGYRVEVRPPLDDFKAGEHPQVKFVNMKRDHLKSGVKGDVLDI